MSDDLLATVAWKYARGPEHRQDLIQEGRIAAWQAEQSHPGQSPYYYVKAAERRMFDLAIRRRRYFGAPERDATSVWDVLWASDEDEPPEPADERSEPSRIAVEDELLREYPHLYLYQVYGYPIREVAATLGETFKFARNRLEAERVTFALEHGRLI